jgi:molybdopterin-synthase adenylyltransferase
LLTDAQIDRYSRQIILPEVGGLGQERLLAAQVTVLAEIDDLAPVLNYLVGAGVGNVSLDCGGDISRVIAAMAELNPEVRIASSAAQAGQDRALLVLAGNDRIIEAARRINNSAGYAKLIFARLGEPYLVAVLNSRPPCLACASPTILAPIERGSFAAPVAMVTAAETIKCLLAVAPEPSRLIEFSGYESCSTRLEVRPGPGCPANCGRASRQ